MERIIVFDTNAYIDFVENKSLNDIEKDIQHLKSLEQYAGYESYMNPTVLTELISNLLDSNGNVKEKYLKACMAVYFHCLNDSKNKIKQLHFSESEIAHQFWRINEYLEDTQQSLSSMLKNIALNPTQCEVKKYINEIAQVKKFINEAEVFYCQSIDAIKNNKINGSGQTWEQYVEQNRARIKKFLANDKVKSYISYVLIKAIHQDLLKKGFNDLAIKKSMIKCYRKNYKVPLEFLHTIVKKAEEPLYDFKKHSRVNCLWDQKILHIVGQTLNQGKPIILTTSDKAMLNAAQTVNKGTCILQFKDYLNNINYK